MPRFCTFRTIDSKNVLCIYTQYKFSLEKCFRSSVANKTNCFYIAAILLFLYFYIYIFWCCCTHLLLFSRNGIKLFSIATWLRKKKYIYIYVCSQNRFILPFRNVSKLRVWNRAIAIWRDALELVIRNVIVPMPYPTAYHKQHGTCFGIWFWAQFIWRKTKLCFHVDWVDWREGRTSSPRIEPEPSITTSNFAHSRSYLRKSHHKCVLSL